MIPFSNVVSLFLRSSNRVPLKVFTEPHQGGDTETPAWSMASISPRLLDVTGIWEYEMCNMICPFSLWPIRWSLPSPEHSYYLCGYVFISSGSRLTYIYIYVQRIHVAHSNKMPLGWMSKPGWWNSGVTQKKYSNPKKIEQSFIIVLVGNYQLLFIWGLLSIGHATLHTGKSMFVLFKS